MRPVFRTALSILVLLAASPRASSAQTTTQQVEQRATVAGEATKAVNSAGAQTQIAVEQPDTPKKTIVRTRRG